MDWVALIKIVPRKRAHLRRCFESLSEIAATTNNRELKLTFPSRRILFFYHPQDQAVVQIGRFAN